MSLSFFGLSASAAGVAASASAAIAISAVSRRCFISLPLPSFGYRARARRISSSACACVSDLPAWASTWLMYALIEPSLELLAHRVRDAFLRDELLRERAEARHGHDRLDGRAVLGRRLRPCRGSSLRPRSRRRSTSGSSWCCRAERAVARATVERVLKPAATSAGAGSLGFVSASVNGLPASTVAGAMNVAVGAQVRDRHLRGVRRRRTSRPRRGRRPCASPGRRSTRPRTRRSDRASRTCRCCRGPTRTSARRRSGRFRSPTATPSRPRRPCTGRSRRRSGRRSAGARRRSGRGRTSGTAFGSYSAS